jgi:hypothetical protein
MLPASAVTAAGQRKDNIMPQNKGGFQVADYSKESSAVTVNLGPLTAVNFEAKHAALDALKDAIAPMILGRIRKTTVTEQFSEDSAAVTDEEAQRETKWLVTLVDDTQFLDVGNTINNVGFGNRFTVEIPCAKLSLLTGGSDYLTFPDGDVIDDFIAALEAVANSPTGGNEVHVESIKHVGRNL